MSLPRPEPTARRRSRDMTMLGVGRSFPSGRCLPAEWQMGPGPVGATITVTNPAAGSGGGRVCLRRYRRNRPEFLCRGARSASPASRGRIGSSFFARNPPALVSQRGHCRLQSRNRLCAALTYSMTCCCVGLPGSGSMNPARMPTKFRKNRDRLFATKMSRKVMAAILAHARSRRSCRTIASWSMAPSSRSGHRWKASSRRPGHFARR